MSQMLDKVSRSVLDQALGRFKKHDLSLNYAVDAAIESQVEPLDLDDELELRSLAENRLFGLGQLQPLLDDRDVEEIWVNGDSKVFAARAGVARLEPIKFSQGELSMIVERMLRSTGRRLDRSSPFVDASLADGSRLHVVIPDITKADWAVNIRKFPVSTFTLADLTLKGALSQSQAAFLSDAVREGLNVLVSGATQAGKTTLLCALLQSIDDSERLITVEETFEIRTTKPDWVAMQTRQANLEGHGEVGLRRLIKEALRMRPNRLVVGEVREAEALDLLIAMNSGLPGLCTIHANSAEDALMKLSTLPLLAGQNISLDFIRPTISSCIQLVVHCQLDRDGRRKVVEIRRVLPYAGQITSERIEC
jgi:pilus assembly protein CpaF